ncbi:hypothetical protein DPMN_029089 [Dreissena polymorpha]|uniref:Uncharacterized protein n=1 Tax=Dreissena polymorpha TaxID=45954 RepID=A0A9D4RFX8_DREPO|nr:hypothetical protein DPMN_029089 [Dreissena polymorpha]
MIYRNTDRPAVPPAIFCTFLTELKYTISYDIQEYRQASGTTSNLLYVLHRTEIYH